MSIPETQRNVLLCRPRKFRHTGRARSSGTRRGRWNVWGKAWGNAWGNACGIACVAGLLGGMVALGGFAQQIGENTAGGNQTYSMRVTSHLVIEPVTVTDKQGNPITGLTAKDFTITEDGAPQEIKSSSIKTCRYLRLNLRLTRRRRSPFTTTWRARKLRLSLPVRIPGTETTGCWRSIST